MKKAIVVILFACLICAETFAQISVYVSANGNDSNDGLSENTPVKSFNFALSIIAKNNIRTITVIGTLDINNQDVIAEAIWVFGLFGEVMNLIFMNRQDEIVITGKPEAVGLERAVLSGRGAENKFVVVISSENAKIRFEHIDISGGEGERGAGLIITGGAEVTLGVGAVVRNNAFAGVGIEEGTCVINGGEVLGNRYGGVSVQANGILYLKNGVIRENNGIAGAGVMISNGGRFTMTGGIISANRASNTGGGVAVDTGGRFDQTGGNISGNIAPQRNNVSRAYGTLGSNL
jgi:hypothetical protein